MQAGGMGHRQALADDLVVAHIQHHATTIAPVTPAIDGVRPADGRHIGCLVLVHRQTIQVAAVLIDQGRDERGAPDLAEAVARIGCGQTVEPRVDEQRLALGINANLMRVQLSRKMHLTRHKTGVKLIVYALVGI